MTDLRDMELLAALARFEHFARAAEACGISQPAFSARIRNLEASLGVPIVKRGNRFIGFTEEGKLVLKWAHTLLADADGLRQEVEQVKGALSGKLKIGVIPTALAFAATLPPKLRKLHPDLGVNIVSTSSKQIIRGLEDFSFDAGISYLDEKLPSALVHTELYIERYTLIVPPSMAPRKTGTVTWSEAASIPLCLLTQDMRNRGIIDETFAQVGMDPRPAMETNAFTAALAQVSNGLYATIAPELLSKELPLAPDAIRLPLVEPEVTKPIGLLTGFRNPEPPALLALKTALSAIPR